MDQDLKKKQENLKQYMRNEFDSYASETFEMNYPTVKVDQRDIHLSPVEDVPKKMLLSVDFLVRHFNCRI